MKEMRMKSQTDCDRFMVELGNESLHKPPYKFTWTWSGGHIVLGITVCIAALDINLATLMMHGASPNT